VFRPGSLADASERVRSESFGETNEETAKERSARLEEGGVMSTMRELAHRSADGVDVTLVWVRSYAADETIVFVNDHREGTYFEIPTEPQLALDVYYHPFAYKTSGGEASLLAEAVR
jgi:hypothetical protein